MNALTSTTPDLSHLRADFPILSETVRGKPFVFLDSAASAQKPAAVIDAMTHTMRHQYANVHRGLHWMSERTSDVYEGVRDKVAALLNAASREEIVFTGSSTGAINLVAYSYGALLRPDQAVLISEMEHHANIVPWQMLRDRRGIELRVAPVDEAGELDLDALQALLADGKVGLVAVTHMSNVLGTVNPAARIAELAHASGALLLLDGSQAAVHRPVDVQAIGADFYVFTGHKLYGPTGIGVLWARHALLEAMPPFMGGGDMIGSVSFERSTYAEVPHKFEAGTPPIVEAIGLGAAIDYVQAIGMGTIQAHEAGLTEHALARLAEGEGLRVIGQARTRGGVISFTLDGAHAHDIATLLDQNGIAVRAGTHCAEPLMRRFGITSTARASFGLYTTTGEIDVLVTTLDRIRTFLV